MDDVPAGPASPGDDPDLSAAWPRPSLHPVMAMGRPARTTTRWWTAYVTAGSPVQVVQRISDFQATPLSPLRTEQLPG